MGDKRLKLTTEQEKLFLETCIEETVRVGYMGVSLQRESWAIVGKKLLEAYGMVVEQKQLKNKYDYLRAKYLAWSYLKRKTGNIYNPHTNMFTLTNEDWDAVCKELRSVEANLGFQSCFWLITYHYPDIKMPQARRGVAESDTSNLLKELMTELYINLAIRCI